CPATVRAASEHPGEPQPNDEPGTPKKSLTPSTSQSRISRNGTQLRKLKGSGATPDAGCPLNRSGPAAQRGWHEWLAGVAAAGQETIIRMRIRRFFCPARAASRDCGPTRTHAE